MRVGDQCLRAVNAFLDAAVPPPLRIIDLAFTGHAQAEVIRTLCALGVAEALAGGPKTAEELAKELGKGSGSSAHLQPLLLMHYIPAPHHLNAPLMSDTASVTLLLVSSKARGALCIYVGACLHKGWSGLHVALLRCTSV